MLYLKINAKLQLFIILFRKSYEFLTYFNVLGINFIFNEKKKKKRMWFIKKSINFVA